MNPLTTIQTYIAGAVAALCIALGAACVWYAPWVGARAQIRHANARTADMSQKLAVSNTSLGTCKANVQTLDTSLTAQNAAVAALKADSDRRTSEATKAAQSARAVAESYRLRAAAVMASTLPRSSDACAAADALILGSLGR